MEQTEKCLLIVQRDLVLFNELSLFNTASTSSAAVHVHCPCPNPDEIGILKSLSPRHEFYEILTPFLMDSQLKKWLEGKNEVNRKRKATDNSANVPKFLLKNSQHFQNVFKKLRKLLTLKNAVLMDGFINFNKPKSDHQLSSGNQIARQCVKLAPPYHPTRVKSATQLRIVQIGDNCSSSPFVSSADDCAVLYSNTKDHYILANSIIYPPKSSVLLGDVRLIRHFPSHGFKEFDLIIMDPPWPNRTVKRQKTYELFTNGTFPTADNPLDQLITLPIDQLLANNGFLCIWLSNSETAHNAAQKLIERWGLRRLALWHWLKICKLGEPVCAFRPEHKVPFESIIFACKTNEAERDKFANFPDEFCIISVPNASPSRKPPISLLLSQLGFIRPVQNGLELFARYLLPNFTSIGYEATKFQHEYYYQLSPHTE